jgi:hypothetical protein
MKKRNREHAKIAGMLSQIKEQARILEPKIEASNMMAFHSAQRAWSFETFGPPSVRGANGPLKHLAKEAREALAETNLEKRREEIADCLFLVFDAANRSGMSFRSLTEYAFAKLRKNQARKWPAISEQDPDGPTEHDRTGEPCPTPSAKELAEFKLTAEQTEQVLALIEQMKKQTPNVETPVDWGSSKANARTYPVDIADGEAFTGVYFVDAQKVSAGDIIPGDCVAIPSDQFARICEQGRRGADLIAKAGGFCSDFLLPGSRVSDDGFIQRIIELFDGCEFREYEAVLNANVALELPKVAKPADAGELVSDITKGEALAEIKPAAFFDIRERLRINAQTLETQNADLQAELKDLNLCWKQAEAEANELRDHLVRAVGILEAVSKNPHCGCRPFRGQCRNAQLENDLIRQMSADYLTDYSDFLTKAKENYGQYLGTLNADPAE